MSPALQADSLPAEPQGKSKNTGVGSLSLLQQIFPTQQLNQGLLHCRQVLYQLSYQEALKNLSNQLWPGDPNHAGVGLSILGYSRLVTGLYGCRMKYSLVYPFVSQPAYKHLKVLHLFSVSSISLPIGNSMMLNQL